jgi:DNA mismatch repair protein MSH6
VYWPEDDTYYSATVTATSTTTTTTTADSNYYCTLSYDDGEVERVDLNTTQFRLLNEEESTKKKKKKRRIQEESDDDDEEMEFQIMEDSSASEEESAYEHNADEEEDEDDEDEEDQWMVTDDDEAATPLKMTKKKKKAVGTISAKKKPRFQVTSVLGTTSATASTPRPQQSSSSNVVSQHSQTRVTPPERITPSPRIASSSQQQQQPPILKAVKGVVNPAGSHLHNHLKFLQNPRDANGRTREDPLYDSHTLKVDYPELKRQGMKPTPASLQWWECKAQYYDAVLFFKTGKFYELYHMDADIGVQVLDFQYMKGEIAHAGFPEVSYGIMAEKLVKVGYKVARVEQTETPDMLKLRKKRKVRGAPTPQVVNREVCSILTSGTRTFCYMDDDTALLEDGSGGGSNNAAVGPLLAIREVLLSTTSNHNEETGEHQEERTAADDDSGTVQPVCEYGITLVDAARGSVTIGQFADDVLRSRMNTLLTAYEPSEVRTVHVCIADRVVCLGAVSNDAFIVLVPDIGGRRQRRRFAHIAFSDSICASDFTLR